MHYAHTLPDQGPDAWEPLEVHLGEVAALAEQHAAKFGAGRWGRLAGLWHDLGKYSEAFQKFLRRANGFEAHLEEQTRVDHSTAGAQHALQAIPGLGWLLAYVIAGRHAGLGLLNPSSFLQPGL
jgi:CRISPR-associated endonuclease/helicase Cas3